MYRRGHVWFRACAGVCGRVQVFTGTIWYYYGHCKSCCESVQALVWACTGTVTGACQEGVLTGDCGHYCGRVQAFMGGECSRLGWRVHAGTIMGVYGRVRAPLWAYVRRSCERVAGHYCGLLASESLTGILLI